MVSSRISIRCILLLRPRFDASLLLHIAVRTLSTGCIRYGRRVPSVSFPPELFNPSADST